LAVLALLMLPWVLPYLTQSQGRFTSGVLLGHYSTWYFGHELLPRARAFLHPFPNFLPWAVLLFPAPLWWRMKPDVARLRIGVATLVLALAFALSGTHRARYMLPVYPGLALLVAEFVVRAGEAGGRRWLRAGWFAVGGITLIAAALVSAGTIRFTGDDHAFMPDGPLEVAVIAGLAAATGLAAVLIGWRPSWPHGPIAVAAGLGGILLVQGLTYPGRYARDNDVRPLASVAAHHAAPTAVVVAYPDLRLSYDFYLGRRVVEVGGIDAVSRMLGGTPGSILITSRERWAALAPVLPPRWRVLESRMVGEREMVVVGSDAS
jgi:4-amino-4-deoxy-L-arabinose transferase